MQKAYYNGRVRTMAEPLPVAEAFIVDEGIFSAVGTDEEILSAAGRSCEMIDLEGGTVLPAFTDSHTHLYLYASQKGWADLADVSSSPKLLSEIRKLAGAGGGGWILGRGWDQNMMEEEALPSIDDIDSATGGRPLFLERICGHAAIVNSAALSLAGLQEQGSAPAGGKVIRRNGIALDEAANLIKSAISPPSRERMKGLIRDAVREMYSIGIAGVHEVGMTGNVLDTYTGIISGHGLPFRVTGYIPAGDEDPGQGAAGVEEARLMGNEFLSIAGVKLFADGSLGARTAALLEEYSDDPGNCGILVTGPKELYDRIAFFDQAGVQAAVHAIGDRANRIVLDIFERVSAGSSRPSLNHRIEHAQLIERSDIKRFAPAGLIPSVQFTHCISDYSWVEGRIGRNRLAGCYPWRSLIDSGCRIIAGSDLPFEKVIDPMTGILAAVKRTTAGGEPEGGWMPEERISVDEAVAAYTVNPPLAACNGIRRGIVGAGYDADFILISRDIFSVPPQEIPEIEVMATVVAGELAYRSSRSPI